MITIKLDTIPVKEQLKLLEMPAKKRKRLIWRAAKEMKKLAANNVRQQQDPNGQPWATRKRGKGKMLMGLRKLLIITERNDDTAIVRLDRGDMKTTGGKPIHAGVIGNTHQRGANMTIPAASKASLLPKEMRGKDPKDFPPSHRQIKALRKLGFKKPGKRKGNFLHASTAWMTEKLNYAQAGEIIRRLRGKGSPKSWNVNLPARAFLGANTKQREQAFARALQSINYGWDVNKQDMKRK